MQKQIIDRRDFIRKAMIVSSGIAALRVFPAWSIGMPKPVFPLHNIPVNKGIDPAWISSLYDRGRSTAYYKTKNELKYIGMPVGGLHSGTVYVGGDGRLWLWQIYNETAEGNHEGIEPKTVTWNDGVTLRKIGSRDGSCFIEPAIAGNKRVLEQGFAVKVDIGGKSLIKELNEDHWDEIVFEPSYPLSKVTYSSKGFPVTVALTVYSPFIPLDAKNSALPATILKLKVKNKAKQKMNVSILGWMENGVNKLTGNVGSGKRINTVSSTERATIIDSTFDTADDALKKSGDYGSMCFTLHAKGKAQPVISTWPVTAEHFDFVPENIATADAPEKLIGGIELSRLVAPGQSLYADFSICWHFNNANENLKKLVNDARAGYQYGTKFKNAREVSVYLAENFKELTETTELWCSTWNDSTLPYWFLERTFINICTLATANTYRFADGRFWGWEGVGACPGTCTHVWQ